MHKTDSGSACNGISTLKNFELQIVGTDIPISPLFPSHSFPDMKHLFVCLFVSARHAKTFLMFT